MSEEEYGLHEINAETKIPRLHEISGEDLITY